MRARIAARASVLLATVAMFAAPAIAYAYDEPVGAPPKLDAASTRTGLLRVVLGLALAFVLAVVAAHPLVRRIERRLGLTVLLSSGLPFLILGVVFRLPSVGVLDDAIVADLRPALEFGLGWLGFVVGMQFEVKDLDAMPDKLGAVVFFESAIPLVATAAICTLALVGWDIDWHPAQQSSFDDTVLDALKRASLRDALALGACAAPAAPVAAVAIARSSGSVAASIVARVTALNDIAGVVVLALICAFFRPTDAYASWKLPHIAWLFVTLGMGGVLGILAYVLVRSAKNHAEEMAYLLGAIGLSAGMSGYLGISPLVTCAIAGALLANLPHKDFTELKSTIVQVERPLYLIFLLIAGALWDPTQWEGWLLVPVFVFARVGGKVIGAHVSKHAGPKELPDAGTLGLALAPQSPIAIATIVSYLALYKPASESAGEGSARNLPWLMTACIGGAVLTELTVQLIARARGGLRFETDIRQPSMSSIRPPPVIALPEPPSDHGGGS
jgi:Kef-type K+ transport system membrane component KefB